MYGSPAAVLAAGWTGGRSLCLPRPVPCRSGGWGSLHAVHAIGALRRQHPCHVPLAGPHYHAPDGPFGCADSESATTLCRLCLREHIHSSKVNHTVELKRFADGLLQRERVMRRNPPTAAVTLMQPYACTQDVVMHAVC